TQMFSGSRKDCWLLLTDNGLKVGRRSDCAEECFTAGPRSGAGNRPAPVLHATRHSHVQPTTPIYDLAQRETMIADDNPITAITRDHVRSQRAPDGDPLPPDLAAALHEARRRHSRIALASNDGSHYFPSRL